jgi:ribosomal protein L11 methylase PrmA
VWGIAIGPVAVEAAAANAARNGLAPVLMTGDATGPDVSLPAADTVVANIALAPILRLARRLAGGPGDATAAPRPRRVLLAGLLIAQRDQALAAFPGYRLASARDDGGWLLLRLEAA